MREDQHVVGDEQDHPLVEPFDQGLNEETAMRSEVEVVDAQQEVEEDQGLELVSREVWEDERDDDEDNAPKEESWVVEEGKVVASEVDVSVQV